MAGLLFLLKAQLLKYDSCIYYKPAIVDSALVPVVKISESCWEQVVLGGLPTTTQQEIRYCCLLCVYSQTWPLAYMCLTILNMKGVECFW